MHGIVTLVEDRAVQEVDVHVARFGEVEGGHGDVGDLLDLQRVVVGPPRGAPFSLEAGVADHRRTAGSVRCGDELELRDRVAGVE